MDIFPRLVKERLSVADVLDRLGPEQWATLSLSAGWSVRHVVAHLVMPFRYSRRQIVVRLLKARGDFNVMADRVACKDASLPTDQLVATLRENAQSRFKPPGAGFEAPLTDLVVHSLDICRPLGIERDVPAETWGTVLDNLVTARSSKHFDVRLDGVALQATDVDWEFGQGDKIKGTAADLVLALAGRHAGTERLTGPGVARWGVGR